MTDGLRVGGGWGFRDRGEGGEPGLTLMEDEGPGEWGWEPGLLGWWRFTVSGERPGVGGRTGRFLWGDRVRSWEVRVWSWGGLDEAGLLLYCSSPTCLGADPRLQVKRRFRLLSDDDPEVTGHSSTFGGDWLLLWWFLLRVPDESVVPGWSSGSEGLW